jgi:peptidoglycan/xylan/chitin deacetylase (PgdA/CDA1 family)
MDMDWAPDEVIDYSMALLAEHGIKATLFMTNTVGADTTGHELAIHPNFTTIDFEKHVAERLEEFPEAKGTRSHSLMYTERLRPVYEKYGIEYQSNTMLYRQHSLRPFKISPQTIEVPLFWMDNFYIEMENYAPSYVFDELQCSESGLKVFDFHPVHVFLNTESLDRYNEAKKFYKEPKELAKYRNTETRGTCDIFKGVLQQMQSSQPSRSLMEIAAGYRTGL